MLSEFGEIGEVGEDKREKSDDACFFRTDRRSSLGAMFGARNS